jgi:hypothetical protein
MHICFPSGLFAAEALDRTAPISALYPTQAIFDLDATLSDSYSSGQVWHNLVPAPADGSAQTDYDFNLGGTSGSGADDPTFTGTAGDAAAYFALDGGDYFSLAGSIPSFFNTIHQGADSHTLIITMNAPISGGSRTGLFSTTNPNSALNVGLNYDTGFSSVFCDQRVLTSDVNNARGGLSGNNVPLLLIISYNAASHLLNIWDNTLTAKTVGLTFAATASGQVGLAPAIFAQAGGSAKMPSSSKIYGCALLKKAATATDAKQIAKFYNKRHARTYVAT